MATTTPSQPGSEDAARIVGERLEADLIDAGMPKPAARAVHQALELVVLRILLVVATKDDVRDAVDGLRREFDARFNGLEERFDARFKGLEERFDAMFERVDGRFGSVWERFAAIDRRFDAVDRRLDAMDRRFDRQDLAIADLRREMRWGFGILFTAMIALIIAVLTRGL